LARPQQFDGSLKLFGNLRALDQRSTQRRVVCDKDASDEITENTMPDPRTLLASLRRPRLLMRAARFGLGEYRRDRDLSRIVSTNASPEATVTSLMSVEARLERTRVAGDAAYSVARHIEVLIALLAEAQILRRTGPA
jgi:Family of unknown function (DUF6477)